MVVTKTRICGSPKYSLLLPLYLITDNQARNQKTIEISNIDVSGETAFLKW